MFDVYDVDDVRGCFDRDDDDFARVMAVADCSYSTGRNYADIFLKPDSTYNEHALGSEGRVEVVKTVNGIEPHFFFGLFGSYDNNVDVENARIPFSALLSMANAVVDNDHEAGRKAAARVLDYVAPNIIGEEKQTNPVKLAKQCLEYGLVSSSIWYEATGGMKVALLNPSIPTLKRVFQSKGEVPVFFTDESTRYDNYIGHMEKVMADDGYNSKPVVLKADDISDDYCYYLGFNTGIPLQQKLKHYFGFELNPAHPDTMNGMMDGVEDHETHISVLLPSTNYIRDRIYPKKPRYNRYYGEIVAKVIRDRCVWGDEAFNFISTVKMTSFKYAESVPNIGDVLCGSVFYHEKIAEKRVIDDVTYLCAANGDIIDKEAPECHENRRKEIVASGMKVVKPGPYNMNVKVAYLKYKTGPQDVSFNVDRQTAKKNQIRVIVERLSATYWSLGLSKRDFTTRHYVRCSRHDAAFVSLGGKKGKFKMRNGLMVTLPGEYVRLMDESAIIYREDDNGVEAIRCVGYNPLSPVSCDGDVVMHVNIKDAILDFKNSFTYADTYLAYSRHTQPYTKSSVLNAIANQRNKTELTYDDALVPTGHDYNGVWDVGDVLEELVC